MKTCPDNHQNPDNACFCRICGSKFHDIPEIKSLSFSPNSKKGEKVTLHWDVADADLVLINNGNEEYPVNGDIEELLVEGPRTIVLTACKNQNKVSKSIELIPSEQSSDVAEGSVIKVYNKYYFTKACLIGIMSYVILQLCQEYSSSLNRIFKLGYRNWNIVINITESVCYVLCFISIILFLSSLYKYLRTNN